MKKRVLCFLFIILCPLMAWAMAPVSDAELSDVTGQAGVNINADLVMNVSIGTMAWGDSTGLDSPYATATPDSGGYIGVRNFNIRNLSVRAREWDSYNGYYEFTDLKPITIDVATSNLHGTGVTFVRFGLGSLEIMMDSVNFMVELGTSGATLGQRLGEIYLGNMEIYINPLSFVDIYKSNNQGSSGITMYFDVTIDKFVCSTISWGDTDGLTLAQATQSNGWIAQTVDPIGAYVGLYNFDIAGTITVNGSVSIDVSTISNGKYAMTTQYYNGQAGNGVVHITIGENAGSNFRFTVNGPITSEVRLSRVRTLDGPSARQLGDIFISQFDLEVLGGSWIDVWAH
jgi:hypothetical protein